MFGAQTCMNNWIFSFKLEARATGPTAMFSSSHLWASWNEVGAEKGDTALLHLNIIFFKKLKKIKIGASS